MSIRPTTERGRLYKTTQAMVAGELREGILSGVLKGGQPLRQTEIAERFRVSRILAREALRQLEGEELISFYPPPRDGRLRALLRGGARDLRDPGCAGNHDDPQGDPTPFPKRNSNVPRRCSTL